MSNRGMNFWNEMKWKVELFCFDEKEFDKNELLLKKEKQSEGKWIVLTGHCVSDGFKWKSRILIRDPTVNHPKRQI